MATTNAVHVHDTALRVNTQWAVGNGGQFGGASLTGMWLHESLTRASRHQASLTCCVRYV